MKFEAERQAIGTSNSIAELDYSQPFIVFWIPMASNGQTPLYEQVGQLVEHITNELVGLCRDPRPISWPTSWLSGVYQPTSCTTSSRLVHQT
jgi:hypothetical protein